MNDISTSIRALTAYQREHADHGFVASLPALLTPSQMAQRTVEVLRIADALDTLASEADVRPVTYEEFNDLRALFQPLGKLPPGELVSHVAAAITAAELRRLETATQRA